jgi:hypothetical protein
VKDPKNIRLRRGGWRARSERGMPLRDRIVGAAIGAVAGAVLFPVAVALFILWEGGRVHGSSIPLVREVFSGPPLLLEVIGVVVTGLAGFLAGRRMIHSPAQLFRLVREVVLGTWNPRWASSRTRVLPGEVISRFREEDAAREAERIASALVADEEHPCIRRGDEVAVLVAGSHPACRTDDPGDRRERTLRLRAALARAAAETDGWEDVVEHPLYREFRGRGAVVVRRRSAGGSSSGSENHRPPRA